MISIIFFSFGALASFFLTARDGQRSPVALSASSAVSLEKSRSA
jgi:hypothetical protein